MTSTSITAIVLVATIAGLAIYDLVAWKAWGVNATISRIIYATAQEWPILPFIVGILAGHLFWPQTL